MINNIYIPYVNGTAIYLPLFVRIFRKLEADILIYLDSIEATEIMLPKVISIVDVEALLAHNPRFVEEWSTEQYKVFDSSNHHIGYLAHWQCEPIYRNLEAILENIADNSKSITIFFDNSGYSYRKEAVDTAFSKNEFQRIEVFMVGSEEKVIETIEGILNYFVNYFKVYGAKIVDRPEESFGGKEEVKDVVVYSKDREIEIIGSHIHRASFAGIIGWPEGGHRITACCGIATSRMAMIKVQGAAVEENLTKS